MNSQEVRQLSTETLSHHCAAQTVMFRKTGESDGRYCYELFRRAAVGEPEAWDRVHDHYNQQIQKQFLQHGIDAADSEDLTQEVWARMHRNVLNLDKWGNFPNLETVLAYLKDCVTSVRLDYFRRQRKAPKELSLEDDRVMRLQSDNPPVEKLLIGRERVVAMLQCVQRHYRHEHDAFLVEQLWGFGRKPQEIARRYPEKFTAPEQVSQQKRNLQDRIARDPECLQFLEDALK